MTSIRWRASAEHDLDLIFARIAQHDADAAERFVRRLQTSVARLADHPYSAPARADIGDGYRAMSTLDHRVIYFVIQGRVEIVRVIDARRDLASSMQSVE